MRRHALWVALLCGCAAGVPERGIRLDRADASVDRDGSALCANGECRRAGAGICGDGFLEPGPEPSREACDDGNTIDGDACTPGCQPSIFTVAERSGARDMRPVVAEDDGGHALIAWVAEEAELERRVVRVRPYSNAGFATSEAVDVATIPGLGDGVTLSLAPLMTGFVLAWGGPGVDDAEGGIRIARLGVDGRVVRSIIVPMTAEERRGAQHSPSVAVIRDPATATPTVALAWIDESVPATLGRGGRAMLRRMPQSFTEANMGPRLVLSAPGLVARQVAAAANRVGTLLVVWAEVNEDPDDPTPDTGRLLGQRFTRDATVDPAPIELYSYEDSASIALAAMRDGRFVLNAVLRETVGVRGRVGPLDATTLSWSWTSDEALGEAERPTVAAVARGEFLAGWSTRLPVPRFRIIPTDWEVGSWLWWLHYDTRGTNAADVVLGYGAQGTWAIWTDSSSTSRRRVRAYLIPFVDECRYCEGATPICDEVTATCVACRGDYDCDEPNPYCSLSAPAACVECVEASQCATGPNVASVACESGECALTCVPGRHDCDAVATNGCEVETYSNPSNCGGCGVACGSGEVCSASACTVPTLITDAATYAAGAPISVTWSGFPGAFNDTLWLRRVATPRLGPLSSQQTPSVGDGTGRRVTSGSLTWLPTWVAPGEYEMVGLRGGVPFVTSAPFTVTGPTPTLSLPWHVTSILNIPVSWANMPTTGTYNLVVANPGSAAGAWVSSSGALGSSGSRSVYAPVAGRYVARVVEGSASYGYRVVAESDPFRLGRRVGSTEPSYPAGGPTGIYWFNPNLYFGTTPFAEDWVGIVEPGWPAERYWVREPMGLDDERSFTARLPPGTYVMRAHAYARYWVADSEPFTVTGTLDVSVDSPETVPASVPFQVSFDGFFGAASDWIGVAPVGSPDMTVLHHVDTGGGESGTVTIPALPDGDYEVRGYFNFATTQSYRVVARDTVHIGPWDE
jgi:cysteine-rich repeat protein